MVPDLDYEYHTITADSIGQESANTFTCHLEQPLKNVVQAKLLSAHIESNSFTRHCYVSVKELDSIFNDRASNVLHGQPSLSVLRGSFASIVTDSTDLITFRDEYPLETQYIDPIRRVDRLTITLRDQTANTIQQSGDNFLVFKFICRKPNL